MQQTGQIGLSKNQWNEIILNQELTKEIDMSIFQALYSFNDHKAYASQIGLLLGFKGKSLHAPLNSEIGRYAKRISKICEIQFTERSLGKYRYWDLFFNGWEEGNYFVWQLRSEIVAALENCKLTGEQPYAEELILEDGFFLIEGAKRTVTVNAYERNSKARRLCINHWGALCDVCGFDFQKTYGNIGSCFIHVHHLVPVSEIGKSYQVNPVNDLRPVCPNCNAMLHTSNPPLGIEQLKGLIKARQLG
jgi:5-methylcytosine-specific restriction protein A